MNRNFAKKWTDVPSTLSDLSRAVTASIGEAIRGHSESISEWITAEAETVQKSARAQAEAISSAKRDQARARYEGLSKAELTDLLAQQGRPRMARTTRWSTGLVEADAAATG